MANYYYVKTGGTATGNAGRYTTQQTGSFAALGAANYYGSIQSMINNIVAEGGTFPLDGDFINPSDLHSESTVPNHTSLPFGTNMVAVDDANVNLGRTSGNYAQLASTGNIQYGSLLYSGMAITANWTPIATGTSLNAHGSKLLTPTSGGGSLIVAIYDGLSVSLENTILEIWSSAKSVAYVGGGARLICNNITLVGFNGVTAASIFTADNSFTSGGACVYISDSDLSLISGTFIPNVGGNRGNDDAIDVRFDNCKIRAGVAFTSEDFKSYDQRALFTRCSDVSAEAEYQYHLHAFGGDVWDEAAIYRNEDTAFTESNQKISYKIETNSDASLGFPLWLDFPMSQYVPLTTTSTLEFYITCATALTDKDIYIAVGYTDATNKNTTNNVISAPETVGGTLDLLAAGTTLTTDATSTWTGGLANLYKIVIDCPTGADCQPTIRLNVTKPSTVLHIASEYELS